MRCRRTAAFAAMSEADKLGRQVSAMLLTGPEPTLGIPKCLTREAFRTWTINQHYRTWNDLPGLRHGKLFISGPCKKRAEDLLKLSRHQLRMIASIFAGACSRGNTPTHHGPRITGSYL
jgi:hypothetical protein